MEKQTITVPEAGRILGVGRLTAYKAAVRGDIPAIRVGKRLVVPKLALEKLLENGRVSINKECEAK